MTCAAADGASACIHNVPSAHVDSVKVPTASARLLRMEGGLVAAGVAAGVAGVCTACGSEWQAPRGAARCTSKLCVADRGRQKFAESSALSRL